MSDAGTNRAIVRPRWLERLTSRWRAPSSSSWTKALGNQGERLAGRHLRRLGYRVVARNLIVGNAEADLVCLTPDRRTIVIVEVKARRIEALESSGQHAARARSPEAAITAHKQSKLRQLARSLAARRRWSGRTVRIDVIAIDVPLTGPPDVRHYENAVR